MFLSRVQDEANAIIGLVKIQRLRKNQVDNKPIFINSALQHNVLFRVYKNCVSPSVKNRKDLAYLLGVSYETIDLWFRKIRRLEDTSDKEIKKLTPLQILRIYLTEAAKLKLYKVYFNKVLY